MQRWQPGDTGNAWKVGAEAARGQRAPQMLQLNSAAGSSATYMQQRGGSAMKEELGFFDSMKAYGSTQARLPWARDGE
eukprot:1218192-Amphidinium_carterae.4